MRPPSVASRPHWEILIGICPGHVKLSREGLWSKGVISAIDPPVQNAADGGNSERTGSFSIETPKPSTLSFFLQFTPHLQSAMGVVYSVGE